MNEFQIEDVRQLYWLLLILGCGAVVVYGLSARARALRTFAAAKLLGFLAPDVSRARQIVKSILVLAAMTAIVLSLIGPRYGAHFEDVYRRQLDVMICLDVSRSMLAEDAGMSRLSRAKDDIKRLLDKLQGGMIGLVAFAGRGELICPLTDDFDYYRLTLEDVGIHSVQLGGTNIGEALAVAVKALGPHRSHHRAIIVMSDGEDHGESARDMARQARENQIVVYTIGIGDQDRGSMIPVDQDGRRDFLMYDGQQVWSRMDPRTLQEIALAGGGEYHPSGQVVAGQRTLEWIYTDRLAPMQEADLKKKHVPTQRPRFAWPAGLALVLLMISTLVSERRGSASTALNPSRSSSMPVESRGRVRPRAQKEIAA